MAALLTRFSNFDLRFSDLLTRLPWRLVLGISCLAFLALAWREHNARLRRDLELQQVRQQTSAQLADLRARADALLRDANQNHARVIQELDSRRRQLEREGEALRQRLLRLQQEEGKQVAEVAALPAAELAKRVGDRLGSRESRLGTRDSGKEEQVSRKRDSGLATRESGREEQASGVGGRVSGEKLSDDQTRRANEHSAPPDTWHLKPGTSPAPSPESRVPSPELVLTEEGARRVEMAFVELDSCRAQAAVKDGALANCQEQVAANAAAASEMQKSLNDLNQAIHLKDEILARVQTEHQAELKAARGSRLGRFVRAVEYVGVGLVIGVVVAH